MYRIIIFLIINSIIAKIIIEHNNTNVVINATYHKLAKEPNPLNKYCVTLNSSNTKCILITNSIYFAPSYINNILSSNHIGYIFNDTTNTIGFGMTMLFNSVNIKDKI